MCEHLKSLGDELAAAGIEETYRGQPWTENCREWIYYNCWLDLKSIRERMNLPDLLLSLSQ